MAKQMKPLYEIVARRFTDYSLRTKMIIAFLVVTLVPIGILAYLNYQTTRAALTESAKQVLFAAASQTANRIDSFIYSMLDIVYNGAYLPDLVTYLSLPPNQRINSELKQQALNSLFALSHRGDEFYISSYAVLDAKGRNVLDTIPSNIDQDESNQIYFQMTLKTGRPYVSPVEFPRKRGAVAFYFSSPVRRNPIGETTDGEVIGVVRIRYSIAIFQKMVSESKGVAGEKSAAILLDENSVILANSANSELLFKSVMLLEPTRIAELQEAERLPNLPVSKLYANLPTFEQGLKNVTTQPFFVAHTRPDATQLEQFAVVKLESQPWIVIFMQPQEVFLAPVDTQTQATIGLAVVIVVVVTVVAISLVQLLSTPITRLTAVAEQVARGNLGMHAPVQSSDEIGNLAHTFNSMTTRLRQTLDDLKQHRDHLEELVEERTRELEQEIAERKRAEETANTANQAKSEFLSHMSHELRTPLNVILGYTQLLKRNKRLIDSDHDAIETVHRSGEHLLMLINDLLDLSKIEARKIELNPTNVHLPGFLKHLVEMTRIHAQQKGITFDYDFSIDLPTVFYADEKRLRQILLNLLNNAIKFTEEGSVTLRVARLTIDDCRLSIEKHREIPFNQQSSIVNLQFSIEDTGIGISPEHMNNIFLPFHQVGNARTGRKGTGLGLAISQQLARLMGSELHAKSVAGQGTTFWFDLELPVIDGRHPFDETQDRLEGGVHLAAEPSHHVIGYNGDRRKILLVDDNDENRAFVRDVLSPLGFEIMEAADGREALDKLAVCSESQSLRSDVAGETKQSPPDLILMDLFMPVMGGFEVARQIREEEQKLRRTEVEKSRGTEDQHPASSDQYPASSIQHPVIIGVSASVSDQVQQESLAVGCDDFLTKPVQIEELLDRLREHLNLEWIYAEPAESGSETPLVFPPQEGLAELLEYAETGDITGIHDYTIQLRQTDRQFLPFADRVDQLAENFQFDQMIEWIEAKTTRIEYKKG